MAAEPLPTTSSAARAGRDVDAWSASTSPAVGTRRADRQGRVVQSMAHKVTRPCSRNGCPAPARASMVLDYAGKQVTLVPLLDRRDPRFLEVCPPHAEGIDVPRGWSLVDERDEEPTTPIGPPTAEEMGSSATVAVLAAALREAPDREAPDRDEPATGDPVAPLAAVAAFDDVAPAIDVDDAPDPAEVAVSAPQTPSGRTAEPPRHPGPRAERQLRLDPEPKPESESESGTAACGRATPVARPVRATRDEARTT